MKLIFDDEATTPHPVPNHNPDSEDAASMDTTLSPVKKTLPHRLAPG